MKNQSSAATINLDCRGTRQFYSAVRTLNRQVGRGNWTTVGRPVRRLRRAERVACISLMEVPVVTVGFVVPREYVDIETMLALGSEK